MTGCEGDVLGRVLRATQRLVIAIAASPELLAMTNTARQSTMDRHGLRPRDDGEG